MPIPVRVLEADPVALDVIRTAVGHDRDLSFDGVVADVRSLASAEIAIVNLDQLAPYDSERVHLIGAPPGVVMISASANPDRLEAVRSKSVALLFEPAAVLEIERALAAAKQVVLADRMESLSTLLTAYRAAESREERNSFDLPRAEVIQWIEADGNYIKIHADDGCRTLRMTMLQAEHEFRDSDIVRIHRKWLVNLGRVSKIRSGHDGTTHIAFPSGAELTIGRAYRAAVRQRLTGAGTPLAHSIG